MFRGISPLVILSGLILGCIAGGFAVGFNDTLDYWFSIPFFGVAGALIAFDLARKILPDPWMIALGIVLLASWVSLPIAYGKTGGLLIFFGVMGAIILSGLFATMRSLMKGQLGWGDVKLALVCGGWIGAFSLVDIVGTILILALASFVVAGIGIATRARSIPYGPAIVIPTYLVTIWPL